MITPNEIEKMISDNLSGAQVKVMDPMNDGVHLSAIIVSSEFDGKNRVQQHRMVNAILKENFNDGSLHALQFKTLTPEQAKTQGVEF